MAGIDEIDEDEARALLGLVDGEDLPDDATLTQTARSIVLSNLTLDRELASRGLWASPIWEGRNGSSVVRACALPPAFRVRYYEGEALDALQRPGVIENVVTLVDWMASDPQSACVALDDVRQLWLDEAAPVKQIATGHDGFRTLVSLLLADAARKSSANLTSLEYMVSLGIPLDDVHDPAKDPPVPDIKASMRAKIAAMWKEEELWIHAALG